MIKIPYEDLIAKIKEKSGLSQEEIEEKINQKLEQLSGLISKEGAAHIIANELGIKVIEQLSGKLQIKNILAGMRDVETLGKVLQVYEIREFVREETVGKVGSFIIGDETATIRVVCWGDKTEALTELKEGDVVKVVSAYVKENRGSTELHCNDRSKILVNPPGETVGEVVQVSNEVKRKKINALGQPEENVELLGTIVQVFEPRFFEVCPQCSRRALAQEGKHQCQKHGAIEPDFAYVLSTVLDDGSGTIQAVFFRQQADQLVQKSAQEMLAYKDAPQEFEEVKNHLLGEIIKVTGRVKKNEMFDRVEFIAQTVDPKPNPEQEIERLKKEEVSAS